MTKEKINLEIKGTPLIKFQSVERIESLQHGHIYAKTLSYYRKLEEKTGDADIGDGFEAMLHVNEGQFINQATGEITYLNDELIATTESDDYVFCMFGIYPSTMTFQFSDKQKEKMLSFGDTALIILDSEEFIKRVKIAAEKKGHKTHFDAVNYYDASEDYANVFISLLKGIWNIAFWKRKSYAYQQEARFVFIPDGSDDDHIEMDIGDVSDISYVVPAEMALTALVEKKS